MTEEPLATKKPVGQERVMPGPIRRLAGERLSAGASMFFAALFIVGAIATILGAAWLTHYQEGRGDMSGVFLAGAVTFILALGGLVTLFHALGMTNTRYPLGLPDGTIQALMALVLILLFFILAVYLYNDVSRPEASTSKLTGLTQAEFQGLQAEQKGYQFIARQVDTVDAEGNPVTTTVYDVWVTTQTAASDVAQELARQLITSLGTLIAAIAAFYFGAKTIGGGQPEGERRTPGPPSGLTTGTT